MQISSSFDDDMRNNIRNIQAVLGYLCRRIQITENLAKELVREVDLPIVKKDLTVLLDAAERTGEDYRRDKTINDNGLHSAIEKQTITPEQAYFGTVVVCHALHCVRAACELIQQLRHLFNHHITLEEYNEFRRQKAYEFVSGTKFEFSKTVVRAAELAKYQGGGLTTAEEKAIRA